MTRKRLQRKAARRVAVVGSLAEARAVLADTPDRPVLLVSPPNAAAYLGAGYFLALVQAVRGEFPAAAIDAVMDCGDKPGFALAALRTGFATVVLRGEPRVRARVAAIARAMGARLLSRPPRR